MYCILFIILAVACGSVAKGDCDPLMSKRIEEAEARTDSIAAQLLYMRHDFISMYRYLSDSLPSLEDYMAALEDLGYVERTN